MKFNDFSKLVSQPDELSNFLSKELEESIVPITNRVERLEKKIDMVILLLDSVDKNLKRLQPLYDLVVKLPFFKK